MHSYTVWWSLICFYTDIILGRPFNQIICYYSNKLFTACHIGQGLHIILSYIRSLDIKFNNYAQQELYRAHSSHAPCICIIMQLGPERGHTMSLTTFTYIHRGQLYTWAEAKFNGSAAHLFRVGTVDGHGYDCQQNTLFVMLVAHATWFEAYWSQFFDKFDRFVMLLSHSGI